jgi:PAS domain S-box-containing protein
VIDYRRLFDAAPDPMLIVDPALRIVDVNAAYLAATATTREGLVGRAMFEAFPDNPDDPEPTGVHNLGASFREVLETHRRSVMALQKYDITMPDGTFDERYWSPVNTPVLDFEGEVELIIHRVEDVTAYVRGATDRDLEAELFMRASEVQALNRELARRHAETDRFIAVLAHELRNPLAAILGGLEVLEDGGGPEQAAAMLPLLTRQVASLSRMADDLLDAAHGVVGKMRVEARRVDLREVVRHAVETAAAAGGRPDVATPPEPVWVAADEVRLGQAIGNLLSNARAAGGRVRVEVGGTDERQASIVVADDGCGFDPAIGAELFEPFRQAGASGAGLGLGLAIVRAIVRAHGGRVSAHSDGPGRGARFTITVPCAGQATAVSGPRPGDASGSGSRGPMSSRNGG